MSVHKDLIHALSETAGERSGRGRLYTIPASRGFADALAAGILARHGGGDGLALARVRILVPNRRAVQTLSHAFLKAAGGKATLLPAIAPLGDVDEDEAAVAGTMLDASMDAALPPAIAPLERQFLLARLVRKFFTARGNPVELALALRMADDLASFLDRMQREDAPPDALGRLVPDSLSAHWQDALVFLKIVTAEWPRMLKEMGLMDPVARRNALMDGLSARIAASGLPHPLYIAGSTGSIPASARLMRAVLSDSNGCVALPGLDTGLAPAAWDAIDEPHPQYLMKRLLSSLGREREDAEIWPWGEDDPAIALRLRAVQDALAPAAATGKCAGTPGIFQSMTRIDCPGRREEAEVIALALRGVLETPGKTAALVTPDRQLARAVRHALARFGLEVDDSAGEPLASTAPARFLLQLAETAAADFAPVPLLALLKHPLCRIGRTREAHLSGVRALERQLLRGARPGTGLGALKSAKGEAAELLERLRALFDDFSAASGTPVGLLGRTLAAAEALAAMESETGAERLWSGEAGRMLSDRLRDLAAALPGLDGMDVHSFPAVLAHALSPDVLRKPYGGHPRLSILGAIEARLQRPDLVILGGLNEGIWPPAAGGDPWMSRPMLRAAGLPLPERRIGQAAHDFIQCIAAPEVIMTRAARIDGVPTVESRWLARIAAFIGPLPGGENYLLWAGSLDAAPHRASPPPSPRPPLEARPKELSVTGVERWMRDPYALYAREILRLRVLDPVDAPLGARDKGNVIHDALEQFLKTIGPDVPPAAFETLMEKGGMAFARLMSRPAVRAFWWPRFRMIAEAVSERMQAEKERRVPFAAEIKAEMDIDGFRLSAKADRIDRRHDGGLIVIDYKTGDPPGQKQIAAGYAPQLPLEGLLAREGAFGGGTVVAGLEFWRLGASGKPLEVVEIQAFEAEIEKALEGLKRLIRVFSDPATPYLSRPRPSVTGHGEYDHLARVAEWQYDGDGS